MTFLQFMYENMRSVLQLLKVKFADSLVSELSVAYLIFFFVACRVLVLFNYYFYLLAI